MKGRDQRVSSLSEEGRRRTQRWQPSAPNLARVNLAARQQTKTRFTALLHHVDVPALERAFRRQKRHAATGIDGITVAEYEDGMHARLANLHARVQTGRYRPQSARRVFIPKADGGQRPLGLPALEDKIVQGAVAEVLTAVYEVDFLGLSYGFRPGRSPHMALTALHTGLMTQRVTWVLDADIRSFFDSVDHEWLLRMIAHRIADRRVLALIKRWLKAGVLENGRYLQSDRGTPQGAGISPLLANIFLHHVLDLWVHAWRRQARGKIILVRYADDFVMGFEKRADADEFLRDLHSRLAKFRLSLHESKTRLVEFGRLPAIRRRRMAQRRPNTFNFLEFTHYCGWTRDGRFIVKHKTDRTRIAGKLKRLREQTKRLMHAPLCAQHRRLKQALLGHYSCYGRPHNWRALNAFRQAVRRIWIACLRRRSQKSRRMGWKQFEEIIAPYSLPQPRITFSWSACRA